ncbi:hypothetical protein QA645_35320 [Bradyrhizobium sp. CIAT3101]|uniref:hypothetical protein n=1 Tax=Bradyrhizobium sp. CIAT3101 TaxID=439387 RepID=UPI0024B06A6B|nr:hypothetical protein [Bradyrhizobium sp. CIAT3101]WFU79720.1 hypothetical protein QA645_35320 [Bradyrhizobium sp. CIAT3101]
MDQHRTALVLFAFAVATAIVVAAAVTMDKVNTRTASNDAPPGTIGLAKPHQPLDRAPGEPLQRR